MSRLLQRKIYRKFVSFIDSCTEMKSTWQFQKRDPPPPRKSSTFFNMSPKFSKTNTSKILKVPNPHSYVQSSQKSMVKRETYHNKSVLSNIWIHLCFVFFCSLSTANHRAKTTYSENNNQSESSDVICFGIMINLDMHCSGRWNLETITLTLFVASFAASINWGMIMFWQVKRGKQ